MKIRCVKSNLENLLKEAENFIGKNLDLPVLSCVLLETKNNFLNITSTNIDTTFNADMAVAVEEEGKVAVLGDILYKVISSIKDEEIELFLEDNVLIVKSNNNRVEINTFDYNDFPSILKLEEQDDENLNIKIKIKKDVFLDGLNFVNYSASKSNIKPELSSVFINGVGKNIYFTATDGFRLAEKQFVYNNDSNDEFFSLLPNTSVNQLLKVLNITQTKELEIYFYKKQIFIKGDEFIIFSRLTDGDYIDYKKLIPEDTNTSVIILKQDFIDSGKLINIFSDDFNKIKLVIKDKVFKIETKNKIGKNKIKIPSVIAGEDVEMDFNYKFIQDVFTSINTDSLELIFNSGKPLLIKPVGDNSFKYIVMPLSK